MAINLNKHKEALQKAWKDVLNDKTETDWAVFGYEGQTNDLKVVSSGSGGIEEMIEDLNSGKIMYAFVRVNDPKTSLPKFVLINWQGEGANIVRKGTCANHVRDVGNFFTGAHVTLNARNEEEVEPQLIIDKVAKSSGSAYSFKAPRGDINDEPSKPVGTNYQRVNPVKEINAEERNQFWMKEEEEEKKRVNEERQRREAERIQLELELQRRELNEAAGREAIDQLRAQTIEDMRRAEAAASLAERKTLSEQESARLDSTLSSEERVNTSDILRKQRNAEAQQLIGKSTSNARSIFEQNTAAGQMYQNGNVRNSVSKLNTSALNKNGNSSTQSPVKQQIENYQMNVTQNKLSQEILADSDGGSEDQFSTIKRSPRVPCDSLQNGDAERTIEQLEEIIQTENVSKLKEEKHIVTEQQIVDEVVYQVLDDDLGLQARALYDYQAADDTEITFDPGDIITHIDQIDDGWWQGLGPDGTFGLFPANHVELIS